MLEALLAVVGLPVLVPIVALLNLLFPGVLRDQWRQYQFVVKVLLTQSTLIFAQWALLTWVVVDRPWWLSDTALWVALILVAVWGALRAWRFRARLPDDEPDPAAGLPRPVEFWALGILAAAGVVYAWAGGWTLDVMTPVTVAALIGFGHLIYRRFSSTEIEVKLTESTSITQPRRVATESVVLWSLVFASFATALYLNQPSGTNLQASPVRGDWPTYRGSPLRDGTVTTADTGPNQPRLLWSFEPGERGGQIMFHSSPTVVDGQVFVGALHQVLSFTQGYVYCINAVPGREIAGQPRAAGDRIWRFDLDGDLKPVFSSVSVVGGNLFFGEGYHQDRDCRLFCVDASNAAVRWALPTTSHVESTPTVVNGRVYFGAGDDGIFCVDVAATEPTSSPNATTPPKPKVHWHYEKLHVDASPLVVGKRMFVGSVLGDVYKNFVGIALDAETGNELWRFESNFPIPAAPAYSEVGGGRVLFTLGNGKVNEDAAVPEGGLVCVAADTGARLWRVPAGNSVLGSPAVAEGRVYFAGRDGFCYAVEIAAGTVVWKQPLGAPVVASPVVSGGRVFVLSVDGVLHALAAESGEVTWRFDELQTAANDAYSSPTLAEGKLYVAVSGKLFCVGDDTK